MKIAGVRVNSFVDYPKNIAYVVFTRGCNMDCWYCHNRNILGEGDDTPQEEVLKDIAKRKGFIDAVVISGGEPTLYDDVIDFARSCKDMGLKVKLDTNGTNPDRVDLLIKSKLVDYIAMDIKAPFSKYVKVTGRDNDIEKIKKSIEIIRGADIDYEFRTTFSPDLTAEDIVEIAMYIKDAKAYYIQQFVNHEFLIRKTFGAHSPDYVRDAQRECSKYLPTFTRGL